MKAPSLSDDIPSPMGAAEYQFLLKLSDTIRPLFHASDIKREVCTMLSEVMAAERVSYAEIGPDGDAIINIAHQQPGIGIIEGSFNLDSYGKQLMDRLRAGETVVIEDLALEPSLNAQERQAYSTVCVQSYIAVPLIKASSLVAILSISVNRPRQWTPNEVFMLQKAGERTWETVERARAEHARRLIEQRSQQIFDSIDQGLCIIKMIYDEQDQPIDYLFLYTNPAFFTHTGLSDVVGKRMKELKPEHEQVWFERYGRIAKTGVPERFEQVASALNRYFEIYGFRVDAPEQRMVGVLFKDITTRQAADQALARANKAKDDFLAVVSHELRNPLNLIQLNAELLARVPEAQTQPVILRASQTLRRTVKSLATVVDDLLDLSRINTGKLALQCNSYDLETAVSELVASIHEEAFNRAITLSCELQPGISIHADSARIEQVIWNLLSNALKFTPNGGAIHVSLHKADGMAVLEVTDTGQGIPADVLPNIFDMFVQEDASSSRAKGGLGIGLALVKQIVELHQGRAEAASQGKGTGASFRIILPLSATVPQETPVSIPQAQRSVKLLLVEDNQHSAELLAQLLSLQGYSVDLAFDGQAGLDAALGAASPYDLILSDIDMPGMDGLQMARQLRSHDKTQATPLVAVTGIASAANQEKIRAAGFNDVVAKPLTLAAINNAVQGLLASQS